MCVILKRGCTIYAHSRALSKENMPAKLRSRDICPVSSPRGSHQVQTNQRIMHIIYGETGSHAKRRHSPNSAACADRQRLCTVADFVDLDVSKEKIRTTSCTCRVMNLTVSGYQMTRAPQEDMASTYQGRHDGCWCYP